METAQNIHVGKNALWAAYRKADSLKRAEIQIELKKVGLFRYWLDTASKQGYDLKMAKGPLRDIFIRLMPEQAQTFGVPAISKVSVKKGKPLIPNAPTLFE